MKLRVCFLGLGLFLAVAMVVVWSARGAFRGGGAGPVFNGVVTRLGEFEQPMEWLGDPGRAAVDAVVLQQVIQLVLGRDAEDKMEAVEAFISARPDSPWTPSLRNNLGKYYLNHGQYTPALAHWEAVWEATKNRVDVRGRWIADYALAHWTRLLAQLGHFEVVERLFSEIGGRPLSQGPLYQMILRTWESFSALKGNPAEAQRCGVLAVERLARVMGLPLARTSIDPSDNPSWSLSSLVRLSQQNHLSLVPVVRAGGEAIAVPSVVHLKQNHYVAVIAQRGDRYEVADPAFGANQWWTAKALNSEASGACLVPALSVPPGYRLLTEHHELLGLS